MEKYNKIISFQYKDNSKLSYGLLNLEKESVIEIDSIFDQNIINETPLNIKDIIFKCPVKPSKIIAIGLNYIDHAEEFKMSIPEEPILFLKANSSLLNPEEYIVLPKISRRVDYEAELVLVVKDIVKNITEFEAPKHILGFTCGNDITARDLQKKDGQWTRSKSFDTFAPIGPWITKTVNIDPCNLNIIAKKSSVVVQCSNTKNMIFNPYKLLSFASNVMTLLPGDVIMTGTPKGVGPLAPGDVIEIEIENIGTLRNYVIDHK